MIMEVSVILIYNLLFWYVINCWLIWSEIHAYDAMGKHIQGVTGGKDQTSGERSLGQSIPI
jgi:hypothetical protein